MSRRQEIRDAIIARLNTSRPTGIPASTKRRFMPGEKTNESRIAVFFAEETPSRPGGRAGAITKRDLDIAIQSIVIVDDPEEADDAAEPLLSWITSQLGNTNLGGLALDVTERRTIWAASDTSGRFVLVALQRWAIEFQTKRDDLSAPS